MTGMKFRRICDKCNTTFFSTDRKARYCPKHQPKAGMPAPAPEPRSFTPEHREHRDFREPREHRPHEHRPPEHRPHPSKFQKPQGRFVAGGRPSNQRPPKPKAPPKPARQPQVSELTPELQAQITAEFKNMVLGTSTEALSNDRFANLDLRDIHTKISQKLWVKRSAVAQVIRDLRKAVVVQPEDLTPEQIEQIAARYAEFVQTGARPQGGRRRTIARELGLPVQAVILAVRKWAQEQYAQSPRPYPTRQELFEIEKCYWRHLTAGDGPFHELPDGVSAELGFVTPYQVLRWVDVLHDNTKVLSEIADPTPEQAQKIIAAYLAYLQTERPPEKALHPTVAAQVGVTAKQVHKVLQTYRAEERTRYIAAHGE